MFHQQAHGLFDIAPFMRTRVEFPIRVRAGAPFAETVVGIWVDLSELLNGPQVAASGLYIFAPVKENGLDTEFEQFQGGKITARRR